MKVFRGTMTLDQWEDLVEIFAEFKGEAGWVIPLWLVELRETLLERDAKEIP